MLEVTVPEAQFFNERTFEFITVPKTVLILEHSLISVSKWESKWCVPFMGTTMTTDQLLDYIQCMCINKQANANVFRAIPANEYEKIQKYIDSPMSATTINTNKSLPGGRGPKRITSEYIYYLMVANGIPFDPCEKWHLKRLINLLEICAINNQADNKMSRKDILAQNRALNAQRLGKKR